MAKALDIDDMIDKLLSVGRKGRPGLRASVTEADMLLLIGAVRDILLAQPSLLEIDPPVKVCGDIHGQYADLLRILHHGGMPPNTSYLFLGDYVDRGKHNLETLCLLLAFKVKWPNNWLLLRGNHECMNINRMYGFFDECQRRYQSTRLWTAFQDAFDCLPFTALIGGRILCMHGGLSPNLQTLQQLRDIPRPMPDPPIGSLALDLLWGDPDPSVTGWKQNLRGVAFVFGADVVAQTCLKLNIDLICRAHQVVQDGYELFAQRKLVTLFSAPHYCGEFDNAAAVMSVSDQLLCSFQVFKPTTKAIAYKDISIRQLTTYGAVPS